MMGKLRSLLISFGLLSSISGKSEERLEPVKLTAQGTYPVGANFCYLEDKRNELTIETALPLLNSSRCVKAESGNTNFGYTSSVYWIKILIDNQTSEETWFVDIQNPLIDTFDTYRNDEKEITQTKLLKETPLERRYRVNQLFLKSDSKSTLFIKANSWDILDLQLNLKTAESLLKRDIEESITIGVLTGIFLALIAFNLFLYLSLKDKDYFFYLLFASVNAYFSLTIFNFPEIMRETIPWFTFTRPLAPLTAFLFTKSFLQTRKKYPVLNRCLNYYMISLSLLMVAYFFIDYSKLNSFEDFYFLIGILILFYAGAYSLAKGFKPSLYYLLGIGCFLAGIGIYLLASGNLIPSSPYTLAAHGFGQALEMALMSLALAGKVKMMQAEKIRTDASAKVKGQLLRVISHDIGNSIRNIKNLAQIGLEQKDESEHCMKKILRSVGITNDIMNFVVKTASLELGRQVELKPVRLADIFDQVAFSVEGAAYEKGTRIVFKMDDPRVMVIAERVSLANDILVNLVSNAIKYSFPGSEVCVSARHHGKAVSILVEDRGIGMTKDQIKEIFSGEISQSRFGTRGEVGTGFGLGLVQAFVKAHNGKIELESRPIDKNPRNPGTIVTITLPAAEAKETPAVIREATTNLPT